MFNIHFPAPLSLASWAVLQLGVLAADEEPAITTAPIFLPYYREEAWSAVRGSVLGVNETAQHTTYTIFCPNDEPTGCGLSVDFPFEFVEGPDTVEFHGTYTSTFIADLGCTLDGTTAATCSGYTSYKSGYGYHTGPDEGSWTSTFSGSEVEWGVLTMAEKPTETDDAWEMTPTADPAVPETGSSAYVSRPLATEDPEASGAVLGMNRGLLMSVVVALVLVVL